LEEAANKGLNFRIATLFWRKQKLSYHFISLIFVDINFDEKIEGKLGQYLN